MSAFRPDIQALRGWAVALVVGYHAGLPGLPGGYLGVDLFFVLSGYLITGLIRDEVAAGRFRYSAFYLRRARRLLPAALATLATTTLAAAAVLDAREWQDFQAQLAGALTFTANLVLWRQSGYFDGSAELKPLLHMWSLALEEQYYLLLPPLLLALPLARWRGAAVAVTLASAAVCAAGLLWAPSAAFYLLPARAWELGVGSLVALGAFGEVRASGALRPFGAPAAAVRALALGTVVVAPWLPLPGPHPGLGAVLMTLATAALLAHRPGMAPERAPIPAHGAPRPTGAQGAYATQAARAARVQRVAQATRGVLVALGDRSYALYLVHWPLFALLNNASLNGPAPPAWRVGAVLLALLGAEALHRGVEQPLRRPRGGSPAASLANHGPALARVGAAVLLASGAVWALAAAGQALWRPTPAQEQAAAHARRPTVGLDERCEQTLPLPRAACQTGPRPGILVWGDSFAMHLVPGLAATLPDGLVQATLSTCGPLLGLAPLSNAGHTRAWAEQCLAHNDAVLARLDVHPEWRTVVLASPFLHLLRERDQGITWQALWRDEAGTLHTGPVDADRTETALARTVAAVLARGRRVWLVAPPPMAGQDTGRCLQRLAAGRPVLGLAPAGCEVDAPANAALQAPTRALFEQLEARFAAERRTGQLQVLRFEPLLCDDHTGRCRTEWQDQPLYRDARHLSHDGSVALARAMDWGRLLAPPTPTERPARPGTPPPAPAVPPAPRP